jgi:hypothetical protein
MSYFPLPNRSPDDQFRTNNYEYRPDPDIRQEQQLRLDYHWSKHSLYGTGGLTRGTIVTPPSWGRQRSAGTTPSVTTWRQQSVWRDRRRSFSLPRWWPTSRYGLNRIQSNNEAIYPNLDYGALIPAAMQAINAIPAPRPILPGGPFSTLNQTNSLHKRRRQTNHQLTGSDQNSGRWIFKTGSEYRVFLSNYTDARGILLHHHQRRVHPAVTNATGRRHRRQIATWRDSVRRRFCSARAISRSQ